MTAAGLQRWRRVLALALSQIIGIAAIVEVAPFGVGTASAAAKPPAAVTTAKTASPIAANAQTVVDVSVWNGGETDLAAPVTLSLPDLPSNLALVRADTTLVGGQWKCAPASATCELVGSDGSTRVPLRAGEAASTRVVLVAGDAPMPETLDVNFTVTAGSSSPAADLSDCLLYTSPSPRDGLLSRMPSSA